MIVSEERISQPKQTRWPILTIDGSNDTVMVKKVRPVNRIDSMFHVGLYIFELYVQMGNP